MEGDLAGIPLPARTGVDAGPEHVVVGEDVPVAQRLDGLRPGPDLRRVAADFRLREDRSDTHIAPIVGPAQQTLVKVPGRSA